MDKKTVDYQSPFDLLLSLQQSVQKDSSGLGAGPQDERGLCFEAGEQRFVTSLGSIVEIMGSVPIVPMPRVKSWLKGAIQLRGQPILINDLGDYLLGKSTPLDHQNRIIVLDYQNEKVGFLLRKIVQFVLLKPYRPSIRVQSEWAYHPYVLERETESNQKYPYVDVIQMCQHPNFINTRRVDRESRVNHELDH